jgi:hypothetical protein
VKPEVRIIERKVEVPVQLPNPDPFNYVVEKVLPSDGFLILEVRYPDCTNYEGRKIMVYENVTMEELEHQNSLDPHFSNNKKFHSPIARFEPTSRGWDMAYELTKVLSRKKMKANTIPPKEIYDVLHEAEAAGVELPKSVEDWWSEETRINESKKKRMGDLLDDGWRN